MAAQLDSEAVNTVRLVGRVSSPPQETVLPSGDVIASFRVVVERPARHESKQRVDALDCTAWTAQARRLTRTWRIDDVVEVQGAIRRRFFASGAGRASRVDIEVRSGRRLRRAPSA